MNYNTIDLNSARSTFPSIFEIFGSDLSKQINIFNEIVKRESIPWHECVRLSVEMQKQKIKRPHFPILNLLSAMNDENIPFNAIFGSIFILEKYLRNSIKNGVNKTTYKEMLKSPDSYYNLIAELDIVSVLQKMNGYITPHKPKDKTSNTNYDIECKFESLTLTADIKWPKNFITREHGHNLLNTILSICGNKIKHTTYVHTNQEVYSENQAKEAAECVLELYKKAIDSGQKDEVTIYSDNSRKTGIRFIRVKLNKVFNGGSELIFLFEGMIDVDNDVEAIRNNLIDGASQIPKDLDRSHITSIFVGNFLTDNFTSELIEKQSLYGEPYLNSKREIQYKGGIFNDDTGTPDLKHIKAVVFFYLFYKEFEDKTNCIELLRWSRLYTKETELTQQQLGLLQDFKTNYTHEVVKFDDNS